MYKILTFISAILILGSCSCFKHIEMNTLCQIIFIIWDKSLSIKV